MPTNNGGKSARSGFSAILRSRFGTGAKSNYFAREIMSVSALLLPSFADWFVFGSEIRAILALEAVPRRLNESRLADFLVETLDRKMRNSLSIETYYGCRPAIAWLWHPADSPSGTIGIFRRRQYSDLVL